MAARASRRAHTYFRWLDDMMTRSMTCHALSHFIQRALRHGYFAVEPRSHYAYMTFSFKALIGFYHAAYHCRLPTRLIMALSVYRACPPYFRVTASRESSAMAFSRFYRAGDDARTGNDGCLDNMITRRLLERAFRLQ